jgi:hypothetical protein
MSETFDQLSRAVGRSRDRRGFLRLVGGAALAVAAGTVMRPLRPARAVTCVGPTNLGPSPCAAGTTPCGPCCCQAGIACKDAVHGVCGCPKATTPCGTACCQKGTACKNAATSTCATAAVACTGDQTACGTTCCPAGQICQNGTCGACIGAGGPCSLDAPGQCCSLTCLCPNTPCPPTQAVCA